MATKVQDLQPGAEQSLRGQTAVIFTITTSLCVTDVDKLQKYGIQADGFNWTVDANATELLDAVRRCKREACGATDDGDQCGSPHLIPLHPKQRSV